MENTIEAYIAGFSAEVQARLLQIQNVFKETYPHVEESIRYGIPCFQVGKEHLYMAAYKKHIGLYPMYGLEHLEDELILYRGKNTKDALHFPHSQELPFELITKIILAKASKSS
jgi:uncharacterized protein YdhG (YjbR/CyaY superfamily)